MLAGESHSQTPAHRQFAPRNAETFIRREDAERFEEVRGDDPKIATNLRIEERELNAGELN